MEKMTEAEFETVLKMTLDSYIKDNFSGIKLWILKTTFKSGKPKDYKMVDTFTRLLGELYPHHASKKSAGNKAPIRPEQIYKPSPAPSKPKSRPMPIGETDRLEMIRMLATRHGYEEIDFQPKTTMISFKKNDIRINVYYTKMTVGTCMKHPKYPHPTQLFRKNVTQGELEAILQNPRVHTNKGYFEKQ